MEYIITGLRAVATASRMISMDSDSRVNISRLPIGLVQQEARPEGHELGDLIRPRPDDIGGGGAPLEAFAEPRGPVHDIDRRLREFVFVRLSAPLEFTGPRVA